MKFEKYVHKVFTICIDYHVNPNKLKLMAVYIDYVSGKTPEQCVRTK